MKSIAMLLAGSATLASMALFSPEAEAGAAAPVADATAKKSIVPQGWKSKGDDLSKFIDDQCSGKDGFEYTAFFTICRQNGIAEEKVKHYEELVASKAHGSQGRAKMTLRNMLATIARKNGKLVGLNGDEVAIDLPKPAVSGAAAKAQEKAAETAAPETSVDASTTADAAETSEDAATE